MVSHDESSEEEVRKDGLYAELEDVEDAELEAGIGAGAEHDDDGETLTAGAQDEAVRRRIAATHESMKAVVAAMTPDQQQRFAVFRRSGLPRPVVRRAIQRALEALAVHPPGTPACGLPAPSVPAAAIPPNAVIAIAGVAKVFVGELVEEARAVLDAWGDAADAPLMPAHVLEAHRRLSQRSRKWRSGPCSLLR